MVEGIGARRLRWIAEPFSFKATFEYAVLARAHGESASTALLLRAQDLNPHTDETITNALGRLLGGQTATHEPKSHLPAEGSIPVGTPALSQARSVIPSGADTVWIVIPVHGAAEAVRKCLESVLGAKTNLHYNVLLVDDASQDPNVDAVMNDYTHHQGVYLIKRAVNGGFSAAVNTAINAVGPRDIVLLNSDATVSDYWIDKLRRAAYERKDIAASCPFSNNAELLSLPAPMRATPAPDTNTLRKINEFLERDPACVGALTAPAGVGFCWFIKASTIKTVGGFDELLTSKGYGEDTEYSLRISKAGMRVAIASDTFVAHEGGVSFGETKKRLAAQNNQRLRALYPRHFEDYDRFLASNSTRMLGQALQEFLILEGGLPNCPLYHLTSSQWDYLTQVSILPAIGIIEKNTGFYPDDAEIEIRAHKVAGLRKLMFTKDSKHYEVLYDELKKQLGPPRGISAQTPRSSRISIGMEGQRLLSIQGGATLDHYLAVLRLAQTITKAGLNTTLVVVGPTVNDRELAKYPCVELPGTAFGQTLRSHAVLLNCTALLTHSDICYVWEDELACALRIPRLSVSEVLSANSMTPALSEKHVDAL